MEKFYFTFGNGTELHNRFFVIQEASADKARKIFAHIILRNILKVSRNSLT
jgi:hypothetical protein